MNNDISIKRAVLHILDNNSSIPVLSKNELEINDELSEYIKKHIDKSVDDPNIKKAVFNEDENNILFLCKMLAENEDDFLPITSDIGNKLFSIMQKNVDIPSADLICCIFTLNGEKHLGILKLNYKTGFTHWVSKSEEGNINSIIRYQTLLPQEGQRIDELIMINLADYHIKLLEKQYEINGEKEFYLSQYFLQCNSKLSNNSKLKILNKVAKEINKKYFDEDFENTIKMKKAVSESIEETDAIQIGKVAQKAFGNNIDIQKEYVEEAVKAGLNEEEIRLPEKLIEKKFRTHKIKTDTGIEINFPLDMADENDKIEFINNPDGTISIIIKNINKISNR